MTRKTRARKCAVALVMTLALTAASNVHGAKISNEERAAIIAEIPEETFISFEAAEPQETVTIFTDVHCQYCRRLHKHIDQFTAAGITVRYASYVLRPQNRGRMISVWCAENPRHAMTQAKKRRRIAKARCDHPIDLHAGVARRIGVRGTPKLITSDGALIRGVNSVVRALEARGRPMPAKEESSSERGRAVDTGR